ncbi:glycosyl transferase [Flavobacterium sp. HJJ]|uniref:glycosyl transferase n=1 Tax=Flavobacterium sp. HJJ TaxID=2783792 RepID=UPI00188C2D04|nr:glycosyl transferase [Flavobacterium sp. HJJ]MBF4470296.1 glycosyl transferase [Flavobacterium sp. HJJ]
MKIAFTICSNNYLAHAKTLGDSFLEYHPDTKFIIGLVDKIDATFDYSMFSNFLMIPVEELEISCFEELNEKYNIVELNTAVKPFYFHYIFKKFEVAKLLYIDPDILITSHFDEVFDILDKKNIVITPHICEPIDDEYAPTDYHTLRGGVFNLGFIALSDYERVKDFLDWWGARVVKYGFCNFSKSMFYDQVWINYVPAFYDNYFILKHPGYNMANWNLHERKLSIKKEKYFVNEEYFLRFFHFSSYKFNKPEQICSYQTRFDFKSRPDLVSLFEDYRQKLLNNNVITIAELNVFYYPKSIVSVEVKKKSKKTLLLKINRRIKKAIKVLMYG